MDRRKAYKNYLKSSHWKTLKKLTFQRDNYRCIKCNSTNNLRGHHIRYKTVLTDCTINDIQTLCCKCHDKLHQYLDKRKKKFCHLTYILTYNNADDVNLDSIPLNE